MTPSESLMKGEKTDNDNGYTLECSTKLCEIDKKQIQFGDRLVIWTDKHWAYVTFGTGSTEKEQKFRILNETEDDTTPSPK